MSRIELPSFAFTYQIAALAIANSMQQAHDHSESWYTPPWLFMASCQYKLIMGMKAHFHRDIRSTAIAPIVLAGTLYLLQHDASSLNIPTNAGLVARSEEVPCRIDRSVSDACSYLQNHCPDVDGDGLIPYARIYYCAIPSARPYLLGCLFLWLMVLFSAMATAARDFLSIHLAVVVCVLDISENLAGVTIFAFGNGSSDLFSTLAAMNSNSGSLAISELFGAAAFITTVVLGLIMVIQPFTVEPSTFVSDVLWFIIAATVLMAFIADGQLTLNECLGIIGLYIAFVCFAIIRAKNARSDGPATETSTDQHPGGLRESSQGVGPVDEDTPLLDADENAVEVRITHTSDAQQQNLYLSEETRTDSRCDTEVEEVTEDAAPRDTPSYDSQEASTVSRAELEDTNASQGLWKWVIHRMLGPSITAWNDQNVAERILSLFSMPFLIPFGLTIPIAPTEFFHDPNIQATLDERVHVSNLRLFLRLWPACVPLVLGPQFAGLVVLQQSALFGTSPSTFLPLCLSSIMISAILVFCFSKASWCCNSHTPALSDLILSFFGFTAALTWIYLTATSAVSLLTTLGMIFHIPSAVLGASIFAIGNSSNDLVADIAVARRGFPVLAASACFGGPMMNMLLGIGGGGLTQIFKNPGATGPSFEVSPTLFVSGGTLILALMVTLTYSFCNSWELNARLGLVLIGIWVVTTIGMVGMGMTAN